ncbi:MAG: hypothetical protein H8E34_10415 [Bacteroidetes bacterium]|nr:hypothetical protein [Bacteroidota bacterium]
MNYKEKYYNHFNIHLVDFCYCEYSWIVKRVAVEAQNIHHIAHGKGKKNNNIENLMALSYENHQKAHNEKLNRYDLKEIHLKFLKNHPY